MPLDDCSFLFRQLAGFIQNRVGNRDFADVVDDRPLRKRSHLFGS
jgi:hypothetical protein